MALLLDTCAVLYLAADQGRMRSHATLLANESSRQELFISPISALEIGRLVALGRVTSTRDPLQFFEQTMRACGANIAALSPRIMISSSFLPGAVHKDPADRILIATARELDCALLTSDRAILTYGHDGHVKTLAC